MIIFLNGCSSAGKSSIAKALQHLSAEPLLAIGIDTFIDMIPKQYWGFGNKAEEGFKLIKDEDKQIVTIKTGTFAKALISSIPKVIKLLADDKHNIIIDEVLFGDELLKDYVEILKQHKIYFISVICSPKIIKERETLRGDRPLGIARGHVDLVHFGTRCYDLTVDTTNRSVFNIAQEILDFIANNQSPQGFKKLQKQFEEV